MTDSKLHPDTANKANRGTLSLSGPAPSFAIAALLFGLTTFLVPGFGNADHMSQMMLSASFIGMIGLAQTFVILTGGIDLSAPFVLTAIGVLASRWADGSDAKLLWVLPAVLAVAFMIGALNGLVVAVLGISPIVVTLGMGGLVEGLLLLYSGGVPAPDVPHLLSRITDVAVQPFRWAVLIWMLVAIVAVLTLSRSLFGRWIYAVGANVEVARLAGLPARRSLVAAYVVSAVIAGVTGLMLSGYVGHPYLGMGEPYLFSGIAAVVIGGTALAGGQGGYIGTIGGALVLTVLASLLPTFNLGDGALRIFYGLIILLALGASRIAARSQTS